MPDDQPLRHGSGDTCRSSGQLGRLLASAREFLGLSQRDLARMAGVPCSTVVRAEQGDLSRVSLEMLDWIARAVHVVIEFDLPETPDELVVLAASTPSPVPAFARRGPGSRADP